MLNGSGVPNQATQVTQALTAAGFRTGLPGDSPIQVSRSPARIGVTLKEVLEG